MRKSGVFILGRAGLRWGVGSLLAALCLVSTGGAGFAAAPDVRRDAAVVAIEQALPSVVNILTKTRVERRGYFYNWWRDNWAPFVQELPPQASAGSGVIIDEDGSVLTNVHVVEGAHEIWVKLADGSAPLRAFPIVGTRKSDVALLQIKAESGRKFKAIRFAADDDLLLGETVLALGNPFGLGGSVSRGILSSKSRRPAEEIEGALEVPDWLQTDAAVNPGNSGGPLINLRGEMIGINVAVYRQGQGIGFAIPVKPVTEALSLIFTPEWLKQLWFGARFKSTPGGFKVTGVQPGSPAEKGGLRENDLVVQVNGKAPRSLIALIRETAEAGDGGVAVFDLRRGQERIKAEVHLVPQKTVFNAALIRQRTGLALQPITQDQADSLGLASPIGFAIMGVDRNSPAAEVGLQPGQLVQAVAGEAPRDLVTMAAMIYGKKKGDRLELQVLVPRRRGGLVQIQEATVAIVLR